MIKEQQHSLNISNSNAQCQGSQTLPLREQELSRDTPLPAGTEAMGRLLHSTVSDQRNTWMETWRKASTC